MRTGRSKALRGVLAAGAAAGLVAALGGGAAASTTYDGGLTAESATVAKTISMRFDAKGPRFTGNSQVKTGQALRIRNLSDPKKIGPHTFTLAAANVTPRSREAQRNCFTPGKVCLNAANAHEFDEETETVGRPLVEAGRSGWDRHFSRKAKTGDSWYTETKGEEFEQVVSARPGTVLRYLCVVHPEMHGTIKVVR